MKKKVEQRKRTIKSLLSKKNWQLPQIVSSNSLILVFWLAEWRQSYELVFSRINQKPYKVSWAPTPSFMFWRLPFSQKPYKVSWGLNL